MLYSHRSTINKPPVPCWYEEEGDPLDYGLGGNESYPYLFQPYGGYPEGVKVVDGYVTLPELPGIGFEGKTDLITVMREVAS